jgi:uncharacterized RDD family membrane protein YckC
MSSANIYCNKCGTPNAVGSQFCSKCGASFAAVAYPGIPAQAPVPAYPQAGYAPAVARTTQYGGFWIRFVAFVLDAIVVQVVVVPITIVVMALAGITGAMSGADRNVLFGSVWIVGTMVRLVFGVVANWLYEAFMESSPRQATLGKMIFSLKVTDLYGNRISFARATARHFAKYLSGFILMIGYIMAGFSDRKQALHDIIAGTLVQKA